jgi:hypothetical protein
MKELSVDDVWEAAVRVMLARRPDLLTLAKILTRPLEKKYHPSAPTPDS